MKYFLWMCFFAITATISADGQVNRRSDEDVQSWNDLQLTVPMTKQFDFFLQGTGYFGNNVTELSDRRIAVGFVYKPAKSFSVTPFYWNIYARNPAGKFVTEHQLDLRGNYHFPFVYKGFGLSHRSQYEYRIRQPQNSRRYRAMLTVDKNIPKRFIPKAKFFVADEVFYDSVIKKFNRNRLMVGITKTLTKQVSADIYYMRQNDGYAHPGDLNVIWTTLKIHL